MTHPLPETHETRKGCELRAAVERAVTADDWAPVHDLLDELAQGDAAMPKDYALASALFALSLDAEQAGRPDDAAEFRAALNAQCSPDARDLAIAGAYLGAGRNSGALPAHAYDLVAAHLDGSPLAYLLDGVERRADTA